MAIDRRRYLKGAALGSLGFCTRWAIDSGGAGPEWTEVVEIDLNMHGRHSPLRGKRIAHISDLHLSKTVSRGYLRRCIERGGVCMAQRWRRGGDWPCTRNLCSASAGRSHLRPFASRCSCGIGTGAPLVACERRSGALRAPAFRSPTCL